MKRLLLILILTLSFQSWTKADDIRDFEIEGMSIGDSLLDHFSKKEIKQNLMLDYYQNLPKNFASNLFPHFHGHRKVQNKYNPKRKNTNVADAVGGAAASTSVL